MRIISDRRYFKALLLGVIFLCALIFRLIYVFNHPVTHDNGIGIDYDSHLYHRIAYNLYDGKGFVVSEDGAAEYGLVPEGSEITYHPEIGRAPVYPLFLAFIYKYFCDPADMESINTWHRNWDKVRVAQSFVDAAGTLLVFFIVRVILPSSLLPAIISSVLYALNPLTVVFTNIIMRETITAFILTLAMLLYINAIQKKEILWTVPAGIGFGLLVLSRPEYIFALFLLAGYIYVANRATVSEAVKKSLIFLVLAVSVVAPWSIRNYLVFKEPIIISVGGRGFGTFIGTFMTRSNYSPFTFPEEIYRTPEERERIETLRIGYIRAMRAGTMEIKQYDDAFAKLTLERIRENPAQVLKVWIQRPSLLWYQNFNANPRQVRSFFIGNYFVFYFPFALIAFFSAGRNEKILMGTILFLMVYLTVVLVPTPSIPRYGVPVIPVLIAVSGIGMWRVLCMGLRLARARKNGED